MHCSVVKLPGDNITEKNWFFLFQQPPSSNCASAGGWGLMGPAHFMFECWLALSCSGLIQVTSCWAFTGLQPCQVQNTLLCRSPPRALYLTICLSLRLSILQCSLELLGRTRDIVVPFMVEQLTDISSLHFDQLYWDTVQERSVWKEFWVLVRKLQENKTRILWLQFLQITELFWECVFMLLQGVVDSSEFSSDYSLLLAVVIQLSFVCFYGNTCFWHV